MKNVIENLGLTKQYACKDVQIIYGTLKSKLEAERTAAISVYLHHKLKPKQLFQKSFSNPQTTNEYKEITECESALIDCRFAVFHILIPLSMFANFHMREGGLSPDKSNFICG